MSPPADLRPRLVGYRPRRADVAALRNGFAGLQTRRNLALWRRDPVAWLADRMGEATWSKQAEVLQSVADNSRTAVKSCHGSGKSYGASRAGLWWQDTADRPEDRFLVSTAPSWPQVKSILWRYMRQGWKAAELPGEILQTAEWKIDGEIVGYGRKPADHDEHGFQGIHAPEGVLVIVDEACGVPAQLFVAADALATNETSRVLGIGNPDDNTAHFARVCSGSDGGWNVVTISAFDTPNLTGEPVPDRMARGLVSRWWVEDKRRRWGETNPLYIAKVLGEFADAEDGLIPLSWVTAAHQRWRAWHDERAASPVLIEPAGPRTIGVDVAWRGEDLSAIAVLQGNIINPDGGPGNDTIRTMARQDSITVAETVDRYHQDRPDVTSGIDVAGGWGAGVYDQLVRKGRPVVAFNGANATRRRDVTGTLRFPNCVTGDARIAPVGQLHRIFRSWHDGSLYRIHMASGDQFTVTPHHNVLTGRGWTEAQTLRMGDHLCDSGLGHRSVTGHPEVDGVPAPISEVYEAMRARGRVQRVVPGAVNFHGDVPVGDVEVVSVDRELHAVDPSGGQDSEQSPLVGLLHGQGALSGLRGGDEAFRPAGRHVLDGGAVFPSGPPPTAASAPLLRGELGGEQPIRVGMAAASYSGVTQDALDQPRGDAEVRCDGGRGGAVAVALDDVGGVDVPDRERGRGGVGAWLDAVFPQDAADDGPVDPDVVRERVQGLSGPVPTDEVVCVEVVPAGGHGGSWVYTMETSTGAYRTSRTIHRNCRSASWWHLRELLDPAGNPTLALPPDDDLTADLTTPKWDQRAGGYVVVESKDEIKKRLGHSPDSGDAVVIACWVGGPGRGADRQQAAEAAVAEPLVAADAWAGGDDDGFDPAGGGWL